MRVPFQNWPETRQEYLVYILDAQETVSEDEQSPIRAISKALMDLHSSAYHLRHETIAEKIGRIP